MAKKEKEAVEAVETIEADHAELRVYELGFHLDPELPTEEAKKLLVEAGYPAGFEVTLDCPNNRYINDDKIAQAIAQQVEADHHVPTSTTRHQRACPLR